MNPLLQDFLNAAPGIIDHAEALARTMAAKTRLLRDAMVGVLAEDKGTGPLYDLWQVYRQAFITNLSAEDFANLQAQTTTYGLFAARCSHPAGSPFTRQSAVFSTTTPFLQDVFNQVTTPELDERMAWVVDDLARLLDQADMVAILEDFRQRSQREDPVVHFYENFLKAYDPKLKEIRGVYYTPEPVVSYIVRSVDRLLQRQFGLPSGLAEMPGPSEKHRVFILDPAAGTGTFLREVIVQIRATLEQQGLAGAWPEYVKQHLLPRLFGFELLMAPYAIGHLKLALELGDQSQSLQLAPGQRLNVFLTNTLEGGHQQVQGVLLAHAIAREAASADGIKREKPVMVVIGNPPYSGHSANKNPWINQLLRGKGGDGSAGSYFHVDGQPLQEKNMKWLNNDYVKFIRFAQWRIEKTGEGILAFVTSHSYLDSPTFRGMRRSLVDTFDDLYLLDLHGDARRRESAPDGGKDINVFDIQEGVAIGLFVKHGSSPRRPKKNVFWAELWGERDTGPSGGKYGWLAANDVKTTPWRCLLPHAPYYLFVPRDKKLEKEYEKGYKVTDIFLEQSVGIATARDKLSIQFDVDHLRQVVNDFSERDVEDARQVYHLGKDTRDWSIQRAQQDLKDYPEQDQHIIKILYRPFDQRFTYYTGRDCGFICRPRRKVMRHMLNGSKLALCIGRAGQATGSRQWDVVLVSSRPSNLNLFRRGGNCLFPLYRYFTDQGSQTGSTKEHNLNPDFIRASSTALGLKFVHNGPGNLVSSFGPEDVLHSIYAVLHSPIYRQRYQDHLKLDFPFLPLISSPALFAELVRLGRQLVALHLLQEEGQDMPTFPHPGNNYIENVSYTPPQDNHSGQVWINAEQCFYSVFPETWTSTIGGYCPAQQWLKDRKGHGLSFSDIHHYRRLCAALATTSRLMAAVDATIDAHGGWPLGAQHHTP
ncbi:MAG: N-6 DNA methylase [Synechococcus sp. SB0668_bin_15]|nr:N-6 DNA methylase [Synechococcus sp. SB0668_bin_15]MYC49065.1 N-6 DNA methylase [Synechococcus sp. SB0662_bin_14]